MLGQHLCLNQHTVTVITNTCQCLQVPGLGICHFILACSLPLFLCAGEETDTKSLARAGEQPRELGCRKEEVGISLLLLKDFCAFHREEAT